MSGGPVFVEIGEDLLLVGMYTGAVFPDGPRAECERFTDLGTASNLLLLLSGHLHLVRHPSQPHCE